MDRRTLEERNADRSSLGSRPSALSRTPRRAASTPCAPHSRRRPTGWKKCGDASRSSGLRLRNGSPAWRSLTSAITLTLRAVLRWGSPTLRNGEELAAWLHDLGVALNYGRDPRLRDTTVLRPDWLANGIYAILRANDVRHGGPLAPGRDCHAREPWANLQRRRRAGDAGTRKITRGRSGPLCCG